MIVKPQNEDGYYVLTTGERRWRAACLLRDRGEYPESIRGKFHARSKIPVISLTIGRGKQREFYDLGDE